MLLLIALAVPCVVALLLRGRAVRGGTRLLDGRYAPLVIGLVLAAFSWATWGEWHPMPLDHDEVAYLMQAEIFASGRWAMPAPPLPDFFGQAHVLVTPVLASKYPPGHSLLLALGTLVGLPALIVFLLNALRVGLLFALVRRASDPVTALLTCILSFLGDIILRFSSSWYSQTTSGAMLMLAWYCLLRWREEHRRGWLLGVAFALGWAAITRPWSAVAFALPIGWVVVRDVVRTRRWRDLAVAFAVGTAVVAILPLWAYGTLGDWRRMPLAEYARDYMPFDFPHFGVVKATPRLTPPPDVATINETLLDAERQHTLANLGPEAAARARYVWQSVWPPPTLVFAALSLIGLLVMPAIGWFGVATFVALFVAYLAHPTWPDRTLYYFEGLPVLTFLGALGFMAMLRRLTGEATSREWRVPAPRAAIAGLLTCVLLLPTLVSYGGTVLIWLRMNTANRRQFEAHVAQLPAKRVIVFVRYGPQHSPHRSLVVNRADWPAAHAWIVYDRGAENARLRALVPERKAYLYDQASDAFVEMAPPVCDPPTKTARKTMTDFLSDTSKQPWLLRHGITVTRGEELIPLSDPADSALCRRLEPMMLKHPAHYFRAGAYIFATPNQPLVVDSAGRTVIEFLPVTFPIFDSTGAYVLDGYDIATERMVPKRSARRNTVRGKH